jgi:hypothetical protein
MVASGINEKRIESVYLDDAYHVRHLLLVSMKRELKVYLINQPLTLLNNLGINEKRIESSKACKALR